MLVAVERYIWTFVCSACLILYDENITMLILDRREIILCDALARLEVTHEMRALPVGDILCEYEDGAPWVAERTQVGDLENCLPSGRLFQQMPRPHEAQ